MKAFELLKQWWFFALFSVWLMCHAITEKDILVWEVLMWAPAIIINIYFVFATPAKLGLTQEEQFYITQELHRRELLNRGITITDLANGQNGHSGLVMFTFSTNRENLGTRLPQLSKKKIIVEKVNWLQEGF